MTDSPSPSPLARRRRLRRRRAFRPIYHFLWAFPLLTMLLMVGAIAFLGTANQPRNPGGWWPIIAIGAALSLGQVAAMILIYRAMRRRVLAHRRALGHSRRALRRHLEQVRAEAVQLAIEDPMTGLYNQRHMQHELEVEFERARRYRQPLSCAMLDADYFKQVNDAFGHPAGDEVIRAMAAVLRRQARQSDLLGHYGGDEFLVLLPNTGCDAAAILADRIRRFLAENPRRIGDRDVVTTCSIGIACYEGGDETATAKGLLEAADRAMYEAKRRGRNRVCLSERDGIREYQNTGADA